MVVCQNMQSVTLDTRCSELHIAQIAERIEDWEEVAPYLNLTRAEEQEIRASHAHQYKLQKRKMLWMWVRKQGKEATYHKLMETFQEAGNALLAATVEEIFQDAYSLSPRRAVATFKRHLKDCYRCTPATCSGQGEWPQLSDAPFVNPEIFCQSEKVDIQDILKGEKVYKVLFEGTAGSGKTTLTRHISQQWAEGKLLHDMDLLIHLTLADPALWSAHSLEDIIPHSTTEVRKAVADVIVERGGKRCCFVMDGWEDLPENMQQSSFIHTILQGKKPGVALPHCSFIVTSRPIASAFLKPLFTTAVEITGFSAESVDSYATQYLTQKGKDPTVFIIALNNNPLTRGLSSNPINTAILLHLFLTIQTGLPTTQTELFRCFLLNLLLRHLVAKASHHLRRLRDFSSLPEDVKPSFHKLCLIAHYATFSGKAASQSSQLLSFEDLCQAGLQDFQETLGLMKVYQQLTWFGYDPHYGFLHSSIQDFLCAVRMSQLSAEEQVRDFQRLVSSNPTSLILPFYAGITKLGNEGVCRGLQKIGMKSPRIDNVLSELSVAMSEAGDTRRLFLAYLHCLYEANRGDLLIKPFNCVDNIISISFMLYRLSVHDLNVVWYFLADLRKICYPDIVHISFDSCIVDDHGIESAVTTLTNQVHTYYQSIMTANMHLSLGGNYLTHKGVGTILSVCDIMLSLGLSRNRPSPSSSEFIALKLLTEALSSDKLYALNIDDWELTSRHAYHLLLLITQARNLLALILSRNELQESVPLLVSAAKNLTLLDITASGIGEKELLEVGLILQSNTNMRELKITSSDSNHEEIDHFRIATVSRFIEIITSPDSQSFLERLYIADSYLESLKCDKIQSALKTFTCRRGFPIKISSYMRTKEANHNSRVYTAALSIPCSLLHGTTYY